MIFYFDEALYYCFLATATPLNYVEVDQLATALRSVTALKSYVEANWQGITKCAVESLLHGARVSNGLISVHLSTEVLL